jgi:hypothetical protein
MLDYSDAETLDEGFDESLDEGYDGAESLDDTLDESLDEGAEFLPGILGGLLPRISGSIGIGGRAPAPFRYNRMAPFQPSMQQMLPPGVRTGTVQLPNGGRGTVVLPQEVVTTQQLDQRIAPLQRDVRAVGARVNRLDTSLATQTANLNRLTTQVGADLADTRRRIAAESKRRGREIAQVRVDTRKRLARMRRETDDRVNMLMVMSLMMGQGSGGGSGNDDMMMILPLMMMSGSGSGGSGGSDNSMMMMAVAMMMMNR